MGDRAVIQLESAGHYSPVLYLHWGGHAVAGIIERTQKRMEDRPGDLPYIFARLVQEAVSEAPEGSTGFGVWNATEEITEADSQGDAGCFVVDVLNSKYDIRAFGGYGLSEDD